MPASFYRVLFFIAACVALVLFAVYMKSVSHDVHSKTVDDLKASVSKEGMRELPDIHKIRDTAQKNPASAEAQAALAHALFRRGDYDEARSVLDAAIRLNPSDAQLYFERAKVRENTGHRADAIPDYEQAVLLDPKRVPVMIRLAELCRYENDTSNSINWCRRVLEIEPGNAAAHRHWALALVQRREYSSAINEFEASLRSDPKQDSVLCDMGVAYRNMSDLRNARDAFDRACRMNPRNSRACNEARRTYVPE
jgi:tetratricopeptide (TPR) repeat protein